MANSTYSHKSSLVSWSTLGGNYYTKKTSEIKFKLPEFFLNKEVNWSGVHVDEQLTKSSTPYDFIIGMDLLTKLGIIIDCENSTITWD